MHDAYAYDNNQTWDSSRSDPSWHKAFIKVLTCAQSEDQRAGRITHEPKPFLSSYLCGRGHEMHIQSEKHLMNGAEMSHLRMAEKNLVDELTGMSSGYVLDFSNATFAEFFRTEVGIDIYDDAYNIESGSKGKRLRAFLDRGQPTAIAKALVALWECREDLRHREGKTEHIHDARRRLSSIIERLGGRPLPPSYDELPEPASPKPANERPSATLLQSLADDFVSLHSMSAQKRGFAFERFLTDVFNAWQLDARGGFRNTGEQIDGSFWYSSDAYLLEAKWHNKPTGATTLHGFQGKVSERHDWTRGLFVSYAGFSSDGLQAFTARRVILMDGSDLHQMLMRRLPLGRVIDAKVRHAAERKEAFAPVVHLFPAEASR